MSLPSSYGVSVCHSRISGQGQPLRTTMDNFSPLPVPQKWTIPAHCAVVDNFPPISSLCFFLSLSLSLSKDTIVIYTRRHFFPFYTRGQFLPFCPFWLLIYFSPTLIYPITFVPTSISCCLTPFSLYLDKFSPHLCLALYQRTNTPLYI